MHEGADLALGSRYVPGGGVSDWGLLRRFISEGGSTYARLVLGLHVRDLTGGFKCFRREVLEAIDFDGVRSQGYAFQVELTYRAVRAGFRVVEVPIVFRDRQRGQSKMSWRIAAEAMWLVPRVALQVAAIAGRCRGDGRLRLRVRPWRAPHARDAAHLAANSRRASSAAGSRARRLAAAGLLLAVWVVSSLDQGYEQILVLRPPFAVGGVGDVREVLEQQHARPRAARDGMRRRLHRRQLAAVAGSAPRRSLALGTRTRRADRDRVRRVRDDLLAERAGVPDRAQPRRRVAFPARVTRAAAA